MTESDAKARSRGISSDMSADAIAHRLDILAELYELVTALQPPRRGEQCGFTRERDATYRPDRRDDESSNS